MTNSEELKSGKVTLDIELKDLLDIVSRSDKQGGISPPTAHMMESEDLKKAWYKHLLISLEKLNDLVETIRRHDLVNLRQEFKEELKELEVKVDKNDDELKAYKKDIIDPINNKVITLVAKLGVWSVIAGFIGSGIMGGLFFLVKLLLINHPSP